MPRSRSLISALLALLAVAALAGQAEAGDRYRGHDRGYDRGYSRGHDVRRVEIVRAAPPCREYHVHGRHNHHELRRYHRYHQSLNRSRYNNRNTLVFQW